MEKARKYIILGIVCAVALLLVGIFALSRKIVDIGPEATKPVKETELTLDTVKKEPIKYLELDDDYYHMYKVDSVIQVNPNDNLTKEVLGEDYNLLNPIIEEAYKDSIEIFPTITPLRAPKNTMPYTTGAWREFTIPIKDAIEQYGYIVISDTAKVVKTFEGDVLFAIYDYPNQKDIAFIVDWSELRVNESIQNKFNVGDYVSICLEKDNYVVKEYEGVTVYFTR